MKQFTLKSLMLLLLLLIGGVVMLGEKKRQPSLASIGMLSLERNTQESLV